MSFLKNTVSLLAIFSVMPVAYAVTARPSVMNTAMAVSVVCQRCLRTLTVLRARPARHHLRHRHRHCWQMPNVSTHTPNVSRVQTPVAQISKNVQQTSCSMPKCLNVCLHSVSVSPRVSKVCLGHRTCRPCPTLRPKMHMAKLLNTHTQHRAVFWAK